jgi:hypothetical protein
MDTLRKIEAAVARLPKEDLARLRTWLDEHAADAWDRQLEEEVAAGRLDKLGNQVIADLKAGKCTEL